MAPFETMTPEERLEHVPAVADLALRAKRRMPHFAWEYLDSGTGMEAAVRRNRQSLDKVLFKPRGLQGEIRPVLETSLFGHDYNLPLGMAPVGMSGLLWPGAELMLAQSAKRANIPYCLSTVACERPEDIGPLAAGNAWFQLYTFADWSINEDLLRRAQDSGFSVLVITIDLPAPSMRERQRRAGLRMPPKVTPKFVADVLSRPVWALATRRRGRPAFRMLENYLSSEYLRDPSRFLADQQVGTLYRWKDLARFRKLWKGPIVIKGVLDTQDAKNAVEEGMDAIVVSNHGGRQFDGAPAPISVLPEIAAAVRGKTAILFDSGVRTGLDMLRALALGADFVLAGRPYLYGVAAHGEAGADHVSHILATDLANNMMQLGVSTLAELRTLTAA